MSWTDKTPSGHSGTRISNDAIWLELIQSFDGSKVYAKIEVQIFSTSPIQAHESFLELALASGLNRVRMQRNSK